MCALLNLRLRRSPISGCECPLRSYQIAIATAATPTGNAQAQSAITDTAAAATRQPTRNPTSNRSEPFNLVNSVPVSEWRFLLAQSGDPAGSTAAVEDPMK